MEIVKLERKDIQKVKDLKLQTSQINLLLQRTPQRAVKKRPGKGNTVWDYVSVGYMQKQLDLLTGWNNSFEIVDERITETQVIVKGKLTATLADGLTVVKMQYGRKDIAFLKETKIQMDIGNDLKAAASDAFKKCCSMLGIARDIYAKDDFKDVEITDPDYDWGEIKTLYMLKKENISPDEQIAIERIIDNQEVSHYDNLFKKLKSL